MIRKKLVDKKKLFNSLLVLSLPIALQSLITFSINMADVFMVQVLGEKELGACMIANIPCLIFYSIVFGFGGSACILCSQYYGKRDIIAIKKVMTVVLDCMLVVGGIFTALLLFKADWVMTLLTNNKELVTIGAPYLRIVAFSYVLTGFITTYMLTIRSVEIVKISLVLEILTLILNITLNYIFIFGNLGAPAMGVKGAALATLISRIIVFCFGIWFLQTKEEKVRFRLNDLFELDVKLIISFFKISYTVIISEILWGLGISLNSIVFSKGGSQEVIAAISIMSMVMQFSTIFITGFAASVEVIIGQLIGNNKRERAKETAKILIIVSVFIGLISSVLTLAVKHPIVKWGKLSLGAQSLSMQLININAAIIIFQAVSSTCISGVLRGGADTKVVLLLDALSLWCCAVPLAWLGSYVWHLSPVVVYIFTRIDIFVKLIFAMRRLKEDKWMNNITENQMLGSI